MELENDTFPKLTGPIILIIYGKYISGKTKFTNCTTTVNNNSIKL